MNLATPYEIISDDKLLKSLGLAIAEATLTRSLLRAQKTSAFTARHNGRLEKLQHLDREIDYLEAKCVALRSRANRRRKQAKPGLELA